VVEGETEGICGVVGEAGLGEFDHILFLRYPDKEGIAGLKEWKEEDGFGER